MICLTIPGKRVFIPTILGFLLTLIYDILNGCPDEKYVSLFCLLGLCAQYECKEKVCLSARREGNEPKNSI